jgi:hypothetical protein
VPYLMARVNVSIPDELVALVREKLPGLNVSGVLQEGLRAMLKCTHDELVCRRCGAGLNHWRLVDQAVGRFYADVMWEVGELVRRSPAATAEGAARVIKRVAADKNVSEVAHQPLPRRARVTRQTRVVDDLRRSA